MGHWVEEEEGREKERERAGNHGDREKLRRAVLLGKDGKYEENVMGKKFCTNDRSQNFLKDETH